MENSVDFLTQLNTMEYLIKEYNRFVKNRNAYVIAIDFTKLKYLNDNFGHAVGDQCLKLFGLLVKKHFRNSLIIRRSGDEFIIVTRYNRKQIEEAIKGCHLDIFTAQSKKEIETTFTFNAGIIEADSDLEDTLSKADSTMYIAKSTGEAFKFFDEEDHQKIVENGQYLNDIDTMILKKKINVVHQPLNCIKTNKVCANEIYGRDDNWQTFFDEEHYDLLKRKYRIKQIDLFLINRILTGYHQYKALEKGNIFINVHYQTLFARENNFIEYLRRLAISNCVRFDKIVLSIDLKNFDDKYVSVFNAIAKLKILGFKVCLDNYNMGKEGIISELWYNLPIDYMKMEPNFWKAAMENKKGDRALRAIIKTFEEFDTVSVFPKVESQEQHDYLRSISEKSLVKGIYYGKEKKLILNK